MIIYFSGTGNTALVARAIAEKLHEKAIALDSSTLQNPQEHTLECNSDRIIWAFPIYSWGIPPVVVNVIKHLNIISAEKATHYMVSTCGDDAGYTDRQWRKLINARGWIAANAFTVIMPNTYTLMKGFDVDSSDVVKQKLSAIPATIDIIASRIENGGEDLFIRGSYPWIKSKIIYPWFVRFSMSPKPFHCTDDCTRCGLCSRICPLENIKLNSDKIPQWGNKCALCLRCYHSCPAHAVAYGKATINKGQYLAPKQ